MLNNKYNVSLIRLLRFLFVKFVFYNDSHWESSIESFININLSLFLLYFYYLFLFIISFLFIFLLIYTHSRFLYSKQILWEYLINETGSTNALNNFWSIFYYKFCFKIFRIWGIYIKLWFLEIEEKVNLNFEELNRLLHKNWTITKLNNSHIDIYLDYMRYKR